MQKKVNGWYFVGGICIAAVVMVLAPKVIEKYSGIIYGKMPRKSVDDGDDWGPIIEKKEKENK